jgi:enoyl-CoA hydratase
MLLRNRHDGVVELTLNRPEKANALNSELVDALSGEISDCNRTRTRLLVLLGAGRNFCGGFDFSDVAHQTDADLVLRFVRIEALLQSIFHAPFHTLALAHGNVYGAGADLVCACTERVAAPDTNFAFPGPRFGVILGTRRLVHRIGWQRASSLLAQSRTLGADEALSLDFLNAVSGPQLWSSLIADRSDSLLKVPAEAVEQLRNVTIPDTRTADMAALIESVRAPGLKERMLAYFTNVKQKSSISAREQ